MSTDAVYILVVIAFFVVLAVGVRIVDRLEGPRRPRRRPHEAPGASPAPRPASQGRVSISPVAKRKPTPGSVRT
jgi:hypothetical protein